MSHPLQASARTPARSADGGAGRRDGVRATVAFACLAMFVSYLPFSAVTGVLGAIAAGTGAATNALQWVVDAFTVAVVTAVLSAGVVADLFGRRRVALAGLMMTALGSGVGLAAGSMHGLGAVRLLWAGQAIAGTGGGAVMSATIGLIAAVASTPAERARWIGMWAAALLAALGVGPFLAAPIADHASWRWLYAPILGAALAAAVFGVRLSAESSAPQGRRLDVPGQATGALTVAALSFGVISGGAHGFGSALAVVPLVLAAVSLVAFVAVERRARSPLLPPRLFRYGGFSAAGLASWGVLFTVSGGVFVLSLFFSHQHVDEVGIALRLGCLFGASALGTLAATRLETRFGARAVMVAGLAVAAAGTATLLTVTNDTGLAGFGWRLAVIGFGNGLVLATAAAVGVQSVPAALAGMAGAANLALRQLGGALGPAVLGAVFTARLHTARDYADAVHVCAAVLAASFVVTAVTTAVLFRRR